MADDTPTAAHAMFGHAYNILPLDRARKAPVVPWRDYGASGGRKKAPGSWSQDKTDSWGLVLNSVVDSSLDLFVVDVDYNEPNVRYLVAKMMRLLVVHAGVKEFLIVTTGREGGGFHLYFRRQAGGSDKYESGGLARFGKFRKETDGGKSRDAYCVDGKGRYSYVVAPGSVHKTGAVYKGYWVSGANTNPLDMRHWVEVDPTVPVDLDRIPVLDVQTYRRLKLGARAGVHVDENPMPLPVFAGDDAHADKWEWLEANKIPEGKNKYGLDRYRVHGCPWCGSTSNRIVLYTPALGTARCFADGCGTYTRKRLTQAKGSSEDRRRAMALATEAALNKAADLGGFEGPYLDVIRDEVRRVLIQAGVSDPDGALVEALAVASDQWSRGFDDQKAHTPTCQKGCRKGVDVITAETTPDGLTHFSGFSTGECKSYRCPECGPRKVRALRASVLAAVHPVLTQGRFPVVSDDLRASSVDFAEFVPPEVLPYTESQTSSGTTSEVDPVDPNLSAAQHTTPVITDPSPTPPAPTPTVTVSVLQIINHRKDYPTVKRALNRWVAKADHPAATWFGVRVLPTETWVYVLVPTDAPAPKIPTPRNTELVADQVPDPWLLIDEGFDLVDLDSWIFDDTVKQANLLVGSKPFCDVVHYLVSYLTGWNSRGDGVNHGKTVTSPYMDADPDADTELAVVIHGGGKAIFEALVDKARANLDPVDHAQVTPDKITKPGVKVNVGGPGALTDTVRELALEGKVNQVTRSGTYKGRPVSPDPKVDRLLDGLDV